MLRRALFLDRDGVINVDSGYVHRVDQVVFIDGIFTLVRAARAAGYRVIVATNQAGIARGYYTEADFLLLTCWLRQRFAASGACLDAVYHCPHHPQHGIGALRRECICRKPAPGMLLRAAHEHEIDLSASILIGDNASDMLAAAAAGIGLRCLLRHGVAASTNTASVGCHAASVVITHLCQLLPYLDAHLPTTAAEALQRRP